jgi:uncharacterized protein YjbI with pentapeptide repeats
MVISLDGLDGPEPDWPRCGWSGEGKGCIGVRADGFSQCLAHLGSSELEDLLSGLRPGGDLDARGVLVSAELLTRILTAVQVYEGGPHARFGVVKFSRARFEGSARFDHSHFDGGAWFDGVQVDGDAWFSRARFQGDASFDGVRIGGDARFGATQFKGMSTGFREARFGGDARFDATQFKGDFTFAGAHFEGGARFSGADFEGIDIRFNDAQFGGYAWFDRVRFAEAASFAGAQFSKVAWFKEAQFQRNANFTGARFSEVAWFEGAQFEADANFAEARFDRAGRLGPLAARRLLLDSAVFSQGAVVEACAAEVSCRRTTFQDAATLRLRYARADLTGAVFATSASVGSADHPFTYPSSPGSDGEREIPESGVREHTREAPGWPAPGPGEGHAPGAAALTSLAGVDVTNLVIIDVDMQHCRFAGARRLDQLHLEGRCRFSYPPVSTRLRWAPSRWSRRQVIAEERTWRGWEPDGRTAFAREKAGDANPQISAERLAALYRALRKAFEDSKNEPGAADFYYGEMEMRRHAPSAPRAERSVLTMYWAICGYGLRASRALAALAAVILAASLVLQHAGFPGHAPGYTDSLLYAAGSMLSLNLTSGHVPAALTHWGELTRILLRIAGPICLGLAALALRGRVKR